jgi:hypothetical protein
MDSAALYNSVPIDRHTESIRLVRLHASPTERHRTNIACTMESFLISNCPEYVAVSYTQGDSTQTHEISVNNETLVVRDNLWLFLNQMSSTKESWWFWIDAICINQQDILEKGHQVGMMKSIFQRVRIFAFFESSQT